MRAEDASDRLLTLAQRLVEQIESVFDYDFTYTLDQLNDVAWVDGPLRDPLFNWANMETLVATYKELRSFLQLINCDVQSPEV